MTNPNYTYNYIKNSSCTTIGTRQSIENTHNTVVLVVAQFHGTITQSTPEPLREGTGEKRRSLSESSAANDLVDDAQVVGMIYEARLNKRVVFKGCSPKHAK